MEDETIVKLLLARDDSALGQIERKYGAYIGSVSLSILRDLRDTEEVKNDVLLALWESVPPQEPRNLKAYLCTLTRRISLNKHKQKHRQGSEVDLTDEELEECLPAAGSPDERLRVKELTILFDAFLRALSPARRRVFLLRYYYYKSIAEIAGQTGFSESKIKSMLQRLREKLRVYLEKEEIYL